MTVPLDRLYNFLDDIVDQDTVIYRWRPHGSKLLQHLSLLKNYDNFYLFSNPILVFHDQEPLDYFFQPKNEIIEVILNKRLSSKLKTPDYLREKIISKKLYLNYIQEITSNNLNIYDNYILVHSEKNSTELKKYVNHGAIPVYYFSHALISMDWYRYAEIDPKLSKKQIQKDFLIYQRAWSGTREYRLKFSELLIDSKMYKNSLSGFNAINENHCRYTEHRYKNNHFKTNRQDLEHYFFKNTIDSNASADYVADDYNQTRIEIILETLFDDQRWHLTEKTFRSIACGQPFMLLSTPGSLGYLKSYGFETFSKYIDESYDQIIDPLKRMKAIISVMQSIAIMSDKEKLNLSCKLQEIANFNKSLFFSKNFYKKIVDEYLNNMLLGLTQINVNKGKCVEHWDLAKSNNVFNQLISEEQYQELLKKI